VNVGEAMVILWAADTTFEVIDGTAGDWIGLYRAGECADQPSWESGELTLGRSIPEDRHKCHIDQFMLGDRDATGQAIFFVDKAGAYEVRYFLGSSTHGGGYVCRKLSGTADAESYMTCALEAAAISQLFTVSGGGDAGPGSFGKNPITGKSTTPGLERISKPYLY